MAEFQFGNIGDRILAGYERGQQIGRKDQFRALAGQAINAPAAERDFLVQQAIANDPESGFALQKQLDDDTDRRQKALFNMARGFKQIHSKNPAQAMAFFQRQIAPGLGKIGFDVDPNTPEADVVNVVDQVLASYGDGSDTSDQVQGQFVTEDGRVGYLTRGGKPVITDVRVSPTTQLINQEGGTPFFAVSGKGRVGQTIGIGGQGGGQEAPPMAGAAGPFAGLTAAVPGLRITSGQRTPEQNAAAGGVPNSFHLTGQAIDIGTPTPEQRAGVNQWAAANGFEVIDNYGDGHVHLEPKGTAPSGPRPVRNPTKAEDAAATTAARIQTERDLTRPQELAKDEQSFRKELNQQLDEPRSVLTAFQRVQAAARPPAGGEPSAVDDLALIFGYMKMLDPGSVVREGEFANAQNTGGVDDWIINAYNRARNGDRLNPRQRQEFVASANKQAEIARNKIDTTIKRAQETARQYQFDPERATGSPDFSGVTATASKAPPQPKGVPRPTTQAEFDRLPSGAVFIDPDDGKTYRKP